MNTGIVTQNSVPEDRQSVECNIWTYVVFKHQWADYPSAISTAQTKLSELENPFS